MCIIFSVRPLDAFVDGFCVMTSEGGIQPFVIGTPVAITDCFMSESYKKRLLEVLKMTQIEQWIREEGVKEGIKESIKEGETKKTLEAAREAIKIAMPRYLSR